jgi:hypothetical protein
MSSNNCLAPILTLMLCFLPFCSRGEIDKKCIESLYEIVTEDQKLYSFDVLLKDITWGDSVASERQYEIIKNADGSIDLVPLHNESYRMRSDFTETSRFAVDLAPRLFYLNPETREPLIPQKIWEFFGIYINKKTLAIHIPPIQYLNERLDELEHKTGLRFVRFYSTKNSITNYLERFAQHLELPFEEIIHDFFTHFEVIFENTDKLNFLRHLTSLLLKFYSSHNSEQIGVSKELYSLFKKRMHNYITVEIDNAVASNVTSKGSRYLFLAALNLSTVSEYQLPGSEEFLTAFRKQYFSKEGSSRSEYMLYNAFAALMFHAITAEKSHQVLGISGGLEYYQAEETKNLLDYSQSTEVKLFAKTLGDFILSQPPPPDISGLPGTDYVIPKILEALR